jgi:DNA polymerase III delta subunit
MGTTAAGLFEELKRGIVHPFYLLLGEDQGAKEEFLSKLRAVHFGGAEQEQEDVSVFHGDEADAGEILGTLATFSFFSSKKLVVVRNCDRLPGLKQLTEHVEKSSGGGGRTLGGASTLADGAADSGGSKASGGYTAPGGAATTASSPEAVLALLSDKKNVDRNLESAVGKKGRSCIFWPMFENEGERWLHQRLRERGIRADGETLRYIIAVTGTTLGDLTNQLETVSNLLDRGEELDLETAKSVLSRVYTYTVFDLTASLFVKGPEEILMIFRQLLVNGEDLLKIAYFLGREVRKILDAFSLKESGHHFDRIAELLGFKKREAARIATIVENVSIPFLRSLCAGLATLDYLIKTSPRELCLLHFERLILGLGRKGER